MKNMISSSENTIEIEVTEDELRIIKTTLALTLASLGDQIKNDCDPSAIQAQLIQELYQKMDNLQSKLRRFQDSV
jgi:hypothetical protein